MLVIDRLLISVPFPLKTYISVVGIGRNIIIACLSILGNLRESMRELTGLRVLLFAPRGTSSLCVYVFQQLHRVCVRVSATTSRLCPCFSNYIVAESDLDRLAFGLGGKVMTNLILSNVQQLLVSADWKHRSV